MLLCDILMVIIGWCVMKKRANILVGLFFLILFVSVIPVNGNNELFQKSFSRIEQRIAYEDLPDDRKSVYN